MFLNFLNKNKFTMIFLFLMFFFLFPTTSFAAHPRLISTIIGAFDSIKTWIVRIATPAVAVAVTSGLLMQKFSFGDEERIRAGKKVVRGSLFAYVFILAIDLVISTIQLLMTRGE